MIVTNTGGEGGAEVENVSTVSQACHKRQLNEAVSRNNCMKRSARCQCLEGPLRNPTKCLWRWEPDRTVGPTSSSVRLQIYVQSHIIECDVNDESN